MSGLWPGLAGPILDIVVQCSEYGQFAKFMEDNVRNVASDVRNMASDVQNTASDLRNRTRDVRNRTKKLGHAMDIANRCLEYGQDKLALFRTLHNDVQNRAS